MITDDRTLSPFGQQIAEEIALSELSNEFQEMVCKLKNYSDLVYQKYYLMDQEFKKEEFAENKDKIILTQGDSDFYFLLKRAALGMVGADVKHMQDICLKYTKFCDRVAAYTRLEKLENKSKEE